jgi:hypothetical protein
MRYDYLFKRRNSYLTNKYNYRIRHLLLRYITPRELNFVLKKINRVKFITKLANNKVDYIEFLAFLINYIMRNNDFTKKVIKQFKRSKSRYRNYEKDVNKKATIVEKLSFDMEEVYNFNISQEDMIMYDNLFLE